MATKDQVDTAVLNFARNSNFFQSPGSIIDAITPAPSTLGATAFGQFMQGLASAMTDAGIDTQVVSGDMRNATIWNHVSLSLFGSQSSSSLLAGDDDSDLAGDDDSHI